MKFIIGKTLQLSKNQHKIGFKILTSTLIGHLTTLFLVRPINCEAAAQQICDNPGHGYNPFFLYGGVGLGKTHLIHAIGNSILNKKQTASVKYIHAESYVSDVVRAYQTKSFEEFKKRYHSLDILLIDDIQFFAGKSRTQEEFFYAFEALIAAKKQLIITCDTYPTELGGIDNRLISRFGSGLTVAIEPPELEMRWLYY